MGSFAYCVTVSLDETFQIMKQGAMQNETSTLTIAELRSEMGLSLEQFAERVGLQSRGRMSVIEREGRCSLDVALAVEALSEGRIDASDLNDDVRAARHGVRDTTPEAQDHVV